MARTELVMARSGNVVRIAAFAGLTLPALLALLIVFALATPAFAREEITLLHHQHRPSAPTARSKVTETITVNAEGDEIRRGIYPRHPDHAHQPRQLAPPLQPRASSRSLRDGRAEPYAIERITNGFKRIRIGDADVFLDYGVHTYIIRYTMTRMARRFEDHDELFWNATGNYWNFPILRADATVNAAAGRGDLRSRRLHRRARARPSRPSPSTRTSDTTARFRTTRELVAGRGDVSVAATFQKGVLARAEGLNRR